MADRARDRERPIVTMADEDILVSSAQVLDGTGREQYAITYKSWQDELWAYLDTVGEYGSVGNWYAAGMSRMHLRAGRWKPGLKEPELLDKGVAADLVNEMVTQAKGGETQFLAQWAKHLFTPGVGFFLAEEDSSGQRRYSVKSADVIKRSSKPAFSAVDSRPIQLYDIRIAPDMWRTTTENSLVGRIFNPDPRYDYMPTSMTKQCLTTLRELDLYNRAIVATLLSRIAFNGILLIPDEVTFAVNPQFKDAPDPFIAELLHFAGRGIKDPGSPGAAIPFPVRVNSAFIEKFKHLILSGGLDPKIIDARESAIKRLSEQLPAPPEAMSGIQDMNHWNAWKSSEDMVKIYFGPSMEILCGGLSEIFLHPMMKVEGEPIVDKDGYTTVMWYDASDLTVQPDNSENAHQAYDKGVLAREPYLEAVGFTDDDTTKVDDKTREAILLKLAMAGTPIPDSFYLLWPDDKPDPAQVAAESNAQKGIDPNAPQTPVAGDPSAAGPSDGKPVTGTPPKAKPKAGAPA